MWNKIHHCRRLDYELYSGGKITTTKWTFSESALQPQDLVFVDSLPHERTYRGRSEHDFNELKDVVEAKEFQEILKTILPLKNVTRIKGGSKILAQEREEISKSFLRFMTRPPLYRHFVPKQEIGKALQEFLIGKTRCQVYRWIHGTNGDGGLLRTLGVENDCNENHSLKQYQPDNMDELDTKSKHDRWLSRMVNLIIDWRGNMFYGTGRNFSKSDDALDVPVPNLFEPFGWQIARAQHMRLRKGKELLESFLPRIMYLGETGLLESISQETFEKLQPLSQARYLEQHEDMKDRAEMAPERVGAERWLTDETLRKESGDARWGHAIDV